MIEASVTTEERHDAPTYHAISDYGIIGDCRSAALIAPDGAIDWCCLPHFDSPAIFCRLLDAEQGGFMQLCPATPASSTMAYLGATNILRTTFTTTDGGRLELLDSMPIRARQSQRGRLPALRERAISLLPPPLRMRLARFVGNDVAAAHRIDRIVTALEGDVVVDLTLKATFDYARAQPTITRHPADRPCATAILEAQGQYLVLVVHFLGGGGREPLVLGGDASVIRAQFRVRQGERVAVLLNYARTPAEAERVRQQLLTHDSDADLAQTRHYWETWSDLMHYDGPYREVVQRSALALKVCTFEPTGAIIAAPTTSLPELPVGVRNWDYRFTWLRDSAFTLDALGALGYRDEARDYFHFLHDLNTHSGADLRIMYGIQGESGAALAESVLPHLSGYMGAHPVRIGNGAALQQQLDIYGEVLDAAYRYVKQLGFRTYRRRDAGQRSLRTLVMQIADHVAAHWGEQDQGLWEVRGPARPFVYSRVMCWVALQRACQMADALDLHHQAATWVQQRDLLRADILAHGFNVRLQSFTQYYESDVLDAANLRLALVDFLPADDPRMQGTIAAIAEHLTGANGLLYRYQPRETPATDAPQMVTGTTDDGLPGPEGAFTACTFWLISALCLAGQVDEAQARFEQVLHYASPLGLFAEELDPETGRQLGNYPQAFTHLGLINAALHLAEARRTGEASITHHG